MSVARKLAVYLVLPLSSATGMAFLDHVLDVAQLAIPMVSLTIIPAGTALALWIEARGARRAVA